MSAPGPTAVRSATGRERDEWFALLDRWGAARRAYREIARWLAAEHGIGRWWAQKLVVEYQQARGVRAPGVRRDGTFEVTASKTVAVPIRRLFDAFVDARRRKKWLTDGRMALEGSRPPRSARFAWEAGPSRVRVELAGRGPSKSTVSVAHGGLPEARAAETMKTRWKARLAKLKTQLEDDT